MAFEDYRGQADPRGSPHSFVIREDQREQYQGTPFTVKKSETLTAWVKRIDGKIVATLEEFGTLGHGDSFSAAASNCIDTFCSLLRLYGGSVRRYRKHLACVRPAAPKKS